MANMNEKMKQLLIAGDAAMLETVIQLALDAGASASSIIDDALLPGMDVVGQRMKSGEMFIPEVLRSAKTMHSALAILTPLLGTVKNPAPVPALSERLQATCTISARIWCA